MRTKTIFTYFIPAVAGLALACLTGCQSTKTHLERQTRIGEGEFTAEVNDLELWYKVSGDGPVCLHPTPGWGPSSELYFLGLTPLEEVFTMVYLDTRGSGRSERPELDEYTMSNFTADIEGLRRHLGVEKMWLMGQSEGGPMVLHYAIAHPDRVRGLILVDAPVGDTSKDPERSNRMQARQGEPWYEDAMKQWGQMPRTQEEFETYMKAVLPFFFASTENLEKHQEVFEKMSLSFHASQGQGRSGRSPGELASRLPEIDIPTLIIVGKEDFICTPSAARLMHSEMPNSELLVIEQAGHFPWLEQPEEFFGGMKRVLPELGYKRD
ncbi:MAG: alpha/beta hydrolase [Fidelibacterota bacterium]|nr:MAG: alpha/beta hydrolase [Candidatus Neomarinimicrobiota bacterium]